MNDFENNLNLIINNVVIVKQLSLFTNVYNFFVNQNLTFFLFSKISYNDVRIQNECDIFDFLLKFIFLKKSISDIT